MATKRPALEQQWSTPMSNYARSAVYAASQALAAQALTVKRSYLTEVVAALLGYRTHAALTADEADTTREYHLDDAEIYVLNVPLGTERAVELGLENGPEVVRACTAVLKSGAGQVGVYESIADFYDSHAREALAQAISDSDEVAGATGESNASFPYDPEMEEACPASSDLWAARDEWTIEAAGDLTGEYDPKGDRMFNGDTLNCRGWLTYRKAGRAGLVFDEGGGSGVADDSWRDRDYEDELAYRQSLEKDQTAG
jgi:hypothetical protein